MLSGSEQIRSEPMDEDDMLGATLAQATIGGFIILLILTAIQDVRHFRISNQMVMAVGLLYLVYFLAAGLQNNFNPVPEIVGPLLSAMGVFIAFTALFAMGVMGGGDVKMATVVALWCGPEHVLDFILLTALTGGLVSLAVLAKKKWGMSDAPDLTNGPAPIVQASVPYGVAIAFAGIVIAVRLLTEG